MSDPAPFLRAEWRSLLMLNYEIDPALVRPWVPPGLEIDFRDGRTYVSLVGFVFLDTRVKGVAIPFHRDFEEVNLRCYVRREVAGELRRGVVFVKEIVPRRAIAWIARAVYGENYVAASMSHRIEGTEVRYGWRFRGDENHLRATRLGEPTPAAPGSEQEFIAEHYWGYTARAGGRTLEYRVEHPPWRIWKTEDVDVRVSVTELYGPEFVEPLAARPASAFVAEGSPVTVYQGRPLR